MNNVKSYPIQTNEYGESSVVFDNVGRQFELKEAKWKANMADYMLCVADIIDNVCRSHKVSNIHRLSSVGITDLFRTLRSSIMLSSELGPYIKVVFDSVDYRHIDRSSLVNWFTIIDVIAAQLPYVTDDQTEIKMNKVKQNGGSISDLIQSFQSVISNFSPTYLTVKDNIRRIRRAFMDSLSDQEFRKDLIMKQAVGDQTSLIQLFTAAQSLDNMYKSNRLGQYLRSNPQISVREMETESIQDDQEEDVEYETEVNAFIPRRNNSSNNNFGTKSSFATSQSPSNAYSTRTSQSFQSKLTPPKNYISQTGVSGGAKVDISCNLCAKNHRAKDCPFKDNRSMLGPCQKCLKLGFKADHATEVIHRADGRSYADFIVKRNKDGTSTSLPVRHPFGFKRNNFGSNKGNRTGFINSAHRNAIQVRQTEFSEADPTPETQLLELFELDFDYWDNEDNYVFVDRNTDESI